MELRLRVLVVEDHDDLRRSLTLGLELEGFRVTAIATAAALPAALAEPLDAVLLDRDLPDAEGLALIPLIRAAQPAVHIIVLSGAAGEEDRVTGLRAGADDYVPKPASLREVGARLTAVGRKRDRARTDVLTFGPLTVDSSRRLVLRDGAPLAMTRRELDVLHYLARNAPRTIGRDELLAAVWGSSSEWQTPATVTEHIRRIRLKIEEDPASPRWITSVRGVGYQFNADAGGPPRTVATAVVLVEEGRIVHATPEAARLAGGRVDEVVGRSAMDFIAPQSIAATSARRETWAGGEWPRPEIITIVRVDGVETHVEIASSPIVWRDRPVSQVTLWPIAGRTARLRQLATGITTEVADAVIMFDPSGRIESFNAAAECLYGWPEREVIGRRVTDVLPWVGPPSDRQRAWAKLDRDGMWHGTVLQRRRDGDPIQVTSSATLLRDDAGNSVGAICVNRLALHEAPQRGVDTDADAELLGDLARAVVRDEFVVDYQRIVRLDDATTTGFEALVRWHHPTRGVLLPDSFIDVAERAGLIVDIGNHVLRSACRQLRTWRAGGLDVHVAVNLSARQLSDPDLVGTISDEIAANDLPPHALWLEVTETSLVEDIAVAAHALAALRSQGACIAIDDFGTGWASLTYLHHFPVDALKIDRIFVDGLETRPSDTAIARSIVALAQELDIGVVAEGIETEAQLAALRALGCGLGQGYLFGHPGPPERVVT